MRVLTPLKARKGFLFGGNRTAGEGGERADGKEIAAGEGTPTRGAGAINMQSPLARSSTMTTLTPLTPLTPLKPLKPFRSLLLTSVSTRSFRQSQSKSSDPASSSPVVEPEPEQTEQTEPAQPSAAEAETVEAAELVVTEDGGRERGVDESKPTSDEAAEGTAPVVEVKVQEREHVLGQPSVEAETVNDLKALYRLGQDPKSADNGKSAWRMPKRMHFCIPTYTDLARRRRK
eukprot:1191165-Prorocentrum_minimum.AAC.1